MVILMITTTMKMTKYVLLTSRGHVEIGRFDDKSLQVMEYIEYICVSVFTYAYFITCFSSLPARNRSLELYMPEQIVVKLCSPYTNRCLDRYFVIESRYNCQSTLYHNDRTIYFATYLMC